MRKGFTLIELLVVIAMIAVLMGAFTSSVTAARRRSMITRATQEVREMTNAILAFEQYAPGRSLATEANGGWADCGEQQMAMILGGKNGDNGEPIPLLYNGHVRANYLRDPWNTPYQYAIVNTASLEGGGGEEAKSVQFSTAAALPNFFRLTDRERGAE